MKNQKIIIIVSVIVFLLSTTWLGFYIYKWEFRKPLLEVYFFSLNRGRSIFIRTPENKTILVGAGQNSEVIREITKFTPFYSRKIDYVFVPSAVSAQIGGLIEVLERYDIGEIIKSEYMSTSTVLSQVMKSISRDKIHVRNVKAGDEFDIDGVQINILFPRVDFKFNKTSLPELGLAFKYKNTSLFLIGNLSKTIQKDISKNIGLLTDQNLLEFYHSGIDSKKSDELVEKIKPEYIFTTKEKTTSWLTDGFFWELNGN
jgi:competence protein ComEC